MAAKLLTYRRFVEREHAEALASILVNDGIEVEIEEQRSNMPGIYVGEIPFEAKFLVKIKGEDFQRANSLVHDNSSFTSEQIDPDHYLFSFSNEELYEILSKPDEWSEFDYKLAGHILKDRGSEIDPNAIEELKRERIKVLAKPEESHGPWIFIGYLSALLGGLLGILIGWHLSTFKKTLPDGRRILVYSTAARQHGNIIFFIGLAVLLIVFLTYFEIV